MNHRERVLAAPDHTETDRAALAHRMSGRAS
jgi:hypothetical protein